MKVNMHFFLSTVLCLSACRASTTPPDISMHGKFELIEHKRQVYDREYLLFLNELIVIKNAPPKFNAVDIDLLNSRGRSADKLQAHDKYERAMDALHCQNALVMKYMDKRIRDVLLLSDGKPNPFKMIEFQTFKDYVHNVLAILYRGHVRASRWMFSMYVKLLALARQNPMALKENFFAKSKALDNFYAQCAGLGMVPDMAETFTSKPGTPFESKAIRRTVEHHCANPQFRHVYASAATPAFTEDNITLRFLMEYKGFEDDVFRTPFAEKLQWHDTRSTLRLFLTNAGTLYTTGRWICEPFVFTQLHVKIQHTVYTHFLLYISYHLHAFAHESRVNPIIGDRCFLDEMQAMNKSATVDVRDVWRSLAEPLRKAIEFLDYDDNVLRAVLRLLERDCPDFSTLHDVDYKVKLLLVPCYGEHRIKDAKAVNVYELITEPNRHFNQFEHWYVKNNAVQFGQYVDRMIGLFRVIGGNLFYVKFFTQDYLSRFDNEFLPLDVTYAAYLFDTLPDNRLPPRAFF